jgi:hypothetical protein
MPAVQNLGRKLSPNVVFLSLLSIVSEYFVYLTWSPGGRAQNYIVEYTESCLLISLELRIHPIPRFQVLSGNSKCIVQQIFFRSSIHAALEMDTKYWINRRN